MNEIKNVLSLFDGMSCAQIALNRLGIKYDKYFASEIDKHAIKVTQTNYLGTVQLGSVVNVDVATLPRIDLLCGGSPCQSFSFAGKRKGMSTTDSIEILTLDHYLELKAADYAFEGQSYLFWEYMRILTDIRKINPDVKFLLENVEMGEKWERVLSRAIGVNGIHINSTLVSAQNRERIYWTNIGLLPSGLFGDLVSTIPQPKDKKIFLKDVLETEVDEKYYLSEKMLAYLNNRKANYNNGKINYRTGVDTGSLINASSGSIDISENIIVEETSRKARCFTAGGHSGGLHSDMELIVESKNEVIQLNESKESGGIQPYQQNRIYSSEGDFPSLLAQMSSGTHAVLEETPILTQRGRGFNDGGEVAKDGKTPPLTSNSWHHNHSLEYKQRIRRLTPTECERLQTVPDGYTSAVSDTQRYRMLGNGWTIDVICHILSYLSL